MRWMHTALKGAIKRQTKAGNRKIALRVQP
jgi:hypothetical protein